MQKADVNWDKCKTRLAQYDENAAFDVPTQFDLVRRAPGPVIFIQNVQAKLRARLEAMLRRKAIVYVIALRTADELWAVCETARQAYDDGEPRIPQRELIAYLIVRKLERQDKWGGTSLNKAFLWSENLPKGGFPKDIGNREIFDVAAELDRYGIVTSKVSNGHKKFALGPKRVVQPILDTKSFASVPAIHPFFQRGACLVTARLLDYNDDVPIPGLVSGQSDGA